jgi:hypothetical protein
MSSAPSARELAGRDKPGLRAQIYLCILSSSDWDAYVFPAQSPEFLGGQQPQTQTRLLRTWSGLSPYHLGVSVGVSRRHIPP